MAETIEDQNPPKRKVLLTQERLKELLRYDPETGIFTWRISPRGSVPAGTIAGSPQKKGYVGISIDHIIHKAHRLAWLYVHGEWPVAQVDHINRVTHDNRLSNLRPATNTQNRQNSKAQSDNKSGLKGVHFHQATGRWRARIIKDGRCHYLGLFDTPQLAHNAYCAKAKELFGEFANTA